MGSGTSRGSCWPLHSLYRWVHSNRLCLCNYSNGHCLQELRERALKIEAARAALKEADPQTSVKAEEKGSGRRLSSESQKRRAESSSQEGGQDKRTRT
jgi:hypothetical protein